MRTSVNTMSNSANSGKRTWRNETSTMASSGAGPIGRSGNVGGSWRKKLIDPTAQPCSARRPVYKGRADPSWPLSVGKLLHLRIERAVGPTGARVGVKLDATRCELEVIVAAQDRHEVEVAQHRQALATLQIVDTHRARRTVVEEIVLGRHELGEQQVVDRIHDRVERPAPVQPVRRGRRE